MTRINEWRKSDNWAVLDTETTGMSKQDQIIEATLISSSGDVVFSSLVKPTVPINFRAYQTHNISEYDLKDAPSWPDVHQAFEKALQQFDLILIYNQSFDVRLIKQTYEAFNILAPIYQYDCVMSAFSEYLRLSGQSAKGKISLDNACQTMSIDPTSVDRHRAEGDCLLTRELILKTPLISNKINTNATKATTSSSSVNISDKKVDKSSTGLVTTILEKYLRTAVYFSDLYLALQENGINMVLTGPSIEGKTFNGVVFLIGNYKLSGSQIGKDFSFNGLKNRGISLRERDFTFFYDIFLEYVSNEQSLEIKDHNVFNSDVLNLYLGANKPLRTVFTLCIDHDLLSAKYKTGLANNIHSQTRLSPSKIPVLRLDKVLNKSSKATATLLYEDSYASSPSEVSVTLDGEEKHYIGTLCLDRALDFIYPDKKKNHTIKDILSDRKSEDKIIVSQFIYNQDTREFIKLNRKINTLSSSLLKSYISLI